MKNPVIFRTDDGTHACAVDRQTDENVHESIIDQMLRRLESLSSTKGYESFEAKQLTGRLKGANGS